MNRIADGPQFPCRNALQNRHGGVELWGSWHTVLEPMVLSSIIPHGRRWLATFLAVAAAASTFGAFGRAPEPVSPRSGKWAHEGARVEPDPSVIWGRLDNGFRYALLPHDGV
ncbi:MAG: hypothetical protein WD941_08440, partial [Opitutus sp.]